MVVNLESRQLANNGEEAKDDPNRNTLNASKLNDLLKTENHM